MYLIHAFIILFQNNTTYNICHSHKLKVMLMDYKQITYWLLMVYSHRFDIISQKSIVMHLVAINPT